MPDEPTTLGASLPSGDDIETVEGELITIKRIEVTTAFRRGVEDTPLAKVTLDDERTILVWDASLIAQLEQIPARILPGKTMFIRQGSGWRLT